MALTAPYRHHNYMGEFANDTLADNGIGVAGYGWTVSNGMKYYDTTLHIMKTRQNGEWVPENLVPDNTRFVDGGTSFTNPDGSMERPFSSIQDAINDITDASSGNRYVVYVLAGEYIEYITMKAWVDLIGVSPSASRIIPTAGTAIAFDIGTSSVQNMGVYDNLGVQTTDTSSITCTAGNHEVSNCQFEITKSGGDYFMDIFNQTGGVMVVDDISMVYSITGGVSSSKIQAPLFISGAGTIFIANHIYFDVDNADSNDIIAAIQLNDVTPGLINMTDCKIDVDNSGNGITAGIYSNGTTSGFILRNTVVDVETSGTGDVYGAYLATITTGDYQTYNNTIDVSTTGSGTAYAASLGAADIWSSHYDVVKNDTTVTGAGASNIKYTGSSFTEGKSADSNCTCQLQRDGVGINVCVGTPAALEWDDIHHIDDVFTWSAVSNPSILTIGKPGLYKIGYSVAWENNESNRKNIHMYLRANGTVNLPQSSSYGYARNTVNTSGHNTCQAFVNVANAGDYVELMYESVGNGTNATTIPLEAIIWAEYVR